MEEENEEKIMKKKFGNKWGKQGMKEEKKIEDVDCTDIPWFFRVLDVILSTYPLQG